MKESFLIYKAFYEPLKGLSDDDLGRLFRWLFEYQINGIEPSNTDRVYMVFLFFKNQFRLDEVKYSKRVESNRGNGLKGGRPKKTEQSQDNPKNPMGFEKPKKADNDNEKDNDKDIRINITLDLCEKIFLDKTETIWTEAFAKKQANIFYNFYESKNWMVGKNKMKSLPHAIAGWISRVDKPELKQSEQREESEREFRHRTWLERNGGNL